MAMTVRPRRSILYMPGSNPRAMEKGKILQADGLILDLEDAVAPDAKAQARTQIGDAIKGGGYGKRELIFRTNGLNTAWGYEDLVFAATSGADAVLLPKVESADLVRQAEQILAASGAPADLKIWCMMETPLAMLNVKEDAGFIAPRAPQGASRGQATPETLERLRRAVEHKGERQPQPAPQPAEPVRTQSRMAGLGRMLERMAGHSDASAPKPAASSISERVNERVAVRARQQETDFDDLASPDAAQDNVEIPAFLRRQAN